MPSAFCVSVAAVIGGMGATAAGQAQTRAPAAGQLGLTRARLFVGIAPVSVRGALRRRLRETDGTGARVFAVAVTVDPH